MSFLDERQLFEREFNEFYSTYPSDICEIRREMDKVSAGHPEWSPRRRKALIYETAARRCRAKVFRHFPFYFELQAGRSRNRWGMEGIGRWLIEQPFGDRLTRECEAWWQPCRSSGLSRGNPDVLDLDHHCVGYDNVLRFGLRGLIAKAEKRLAREASKEGREFLEATIIGNRALIAIADKFADEAESMLTGETDAAVRHRLERIADCARRVPGDPPQTFYEALNTILFMREILGSLEGIGESVLGHLDRMVWPYYQRDVAAGRMTRGEAKDLLRAFLAMTDAKFDFRDRHETSTTVVIGGCDADGAIVFNEITRMIVEAYQELRLVNPKLQGRISPRHPQKYFDLLGELAARGTNVLAIFNDDVIIEANVRQGKSLRDCRLYVAGGCQENVLQNTEINSRASIFLNLPHVFLMGFFSDPWRWFAEREGIDLKRYDGCRSFDVFHAAFLANLEAVVGAHIDQRNRSEAQGGQFNPCPLHSATLDGCIEKGRDMMEGGCRYSAASVSLVGIGTLIDSLFAVREAVYHRKQLSLRQLRDMLERNFDGEEAFRRYLINRVPKFGQDDEEVRQFSARVFADVARVSSGRPNSRGGRYEASLFVHRAFADMGQKTGATPDGRRAGELLSQGMGPSLLSLGRTADIGQVMRAVGPLDLADYPIVAVLDLKLPLSPKGVGPDTIVPIIRRFLDSGGSVLQMNVVDSQALVDARQHPERHADLVVRVSGYSARFTALPEQIQEEIIGRTMALA
ncbi:MAG: hypothetical protein GXP25_15060 [Planctomycetes bacterium]|nr:hypothetical protein [Planctomycetota bacterium]